MLCSLEFMIAQAERFVKREEACLSMESKKAHKRAKFQKTLYKTRKNGYPIRVYCKTRMRWDAAAMSAKRAGGWCNSGREARQEITCPAALPKHE